MRLENINFEPIGGKLHRLSIVFTTGEHVCIMDAADRWVTEALTIPPGEAAGVLRTAETALTEARDELAELHDEESAVLDDRKEAVLRGDPIASIEKKLASVQARIMVLQGRVDQLTGVVVEMQTQAKREATDAARKKLSLLEAEVNEAVRIADAVLENHADVLAAVLASRAKAEALARHAKRLLRVT